MDLTDHLVLMPLQKQTDLQPECPVYIHCTRRSVDKRTGAAFLQLRMVNRSDWRIDAVFLRIEGLDRHGKQCFVMPEVIVPQCNARPNTIFGEERLLAIDRAPAARLLVTVERVSFMNGLLWRKGDGQKPVKSSSWKICTCAMPNPPNAAKCRLCGRSFVAAQPEVVFEETPVQVAPAQEESPQVQKSFVPPDFDPYEFMRPRPIVRSQEEIDALEQERPKKTSKSLIILFIILSILAAASITFLAYYAYASGIIS